MEAVVGFALACNILQVIDFASKTGSRVYQIYNTGATFDITELANSTSQLEDVAKVLNVALSTSKAQSSVTAAEAEVQKLAVNVSSATKELIAELNKLKSQGGKRNALLKSIRAIRKRSEIEALEKKLSKCQSILNSGLLIRLREQNHATLLMQQSEFHKLDDTLQAFIKSLAHHHKQLVDSIIKDNDQTRLAVKNEGTNVRSGFEQTIKTFEQEKSVTERRERFLQSLRYADVFARYNQVSGSTSKTFEWIFEREMHQPYSSFIDWLQGDSGIYFIQGKAGSGKSTLMKFIVEHPQTSILLGKWSGRSHPKLITHYFWLAGSFSQQSLHGFLASFCHQLLQNEDVTIDWLSQTHVEIQNKRTTSDWNEKDLKSILLDTLQGPRSKPCCLFVDGVDEFGESDKFALLVDLLHQISSLDNVKVCLASRPERRVVSALKEAPGLRLQDLTHEDISTYADVELKQLCKTLSLALDEESLKSITHEIVHKAEGVFLWVKLAVNSIGRGMTNQDTPERLQYRLKMLPSDIGKLYTDMIKRLGDDWPVYQQQASLYLTVCRMAVSLPMPDYVMPLAEISSLAMLLIENKMTHSAPITIETTHDAAELTKRCHHMESKVTLCTGGMLEVRGAEKPEASGVRDLTQEMKFIHFSHRSVLDFIQSPEGAALLDECGPQPSVHDVCSTIVHSILLSVRCCKVRGLYNTRIAYLSENWYVQLLQFLEDLLSEGKISVDEIKIMTEAIDATFQSALFSETVGTGTEKDKNIEFTFFEGGSFPIDRMGNFIKWGLPEYLIEDWSGICDGDDWFRVPWTAKYLSYLLFCSTYHPCSHVNLHSQLLDAGADPNALFPLQTTMGVTSDSPWTEFLVTLFLYPDEDGCFIASARSSRRWYRFEYWSKLERTISKYLEHRADLQQRLFVTKTTYTGDIPSDFAYKYEFFRYPPYIEGLFVTTAQFMLKHYVRYMPQKYNLLNKFRTSDVAQPELIAYLCGYDYDNDDGKCCVIAQNHPQTTQDENSGLQSAETHRDCVKTSLRELLRQQGRILSEDHPARITGSIPRFKEPWPPSNAPIPNRSDESVSNRSIQEQADNHSE